LPNQKNKNILVINDSPTLNALLQVVLEKEGYTVTVAETGLSGIEIAVAGEFQLILLDYNLPGINGAEVCRRLRKNSVTKNIPIAFASATADKKISEELNDTDVDAYINPPFMGDVFIDKLRSLLEVD
jgi:two-component system, sensor histidine kinase and response regulator